jgi:hypothetical protein
MRQFVNLQHSRVATLAIGTIFLIIVAVVDSPNGWREFLYLTRLRFLLRRFVVIWMLAYGTLRASFVSAIVLLTNRRRGIRVAVRENLHWRGGLLSCQIMTAITIWTVKITASVNSPMRTARV